MHSTAQIRIWTLLLLLGIPFTVSSSLPVAEDVTDSTASSSRERDDMNAADALRQAAVGKRGGLTDETELQELRDQAIANASISLSNTSLADLESDNLTQLLQVKYRERKRQERLLGIQTQILQRLRISRQPNISANFFSEEDQRRINAIVQRMDQFNNNNNNNNNHQGSNPRMEHRTLFEHRQLNDEGSVNRRTYRLHTTMQRLQSLYPSCEIPNNTDRITWDLPETFRVFYDLPFSRYSLGPELTILLAKLRLYKMASADQPEQSPSSLSRYNLLDALVPNSQTAVIHVSVYQYMKPLRSNKKERKRLVDSRVVPLHHEGWVEFNVVSSLNHWLRYQNRNFGFDVEVHDAFGNKLDPNNYFRSLNCSAAETTPQDPPFPNIMEIHPEMMSENESSLFDNDTYPTLDLQTADVTALDSAGFHLYQATLFPNNDAEANKRLRKKRHVQRRQHANELTEIEKPRCRKDVVHIDFAELGLDSIIISPTGVDWTFCTGTCGTQNLGKPKAVYRKKFSAKSSRQLLGLGGFTKFFWKSPNPISGFRCTSTARKSLNVLMYNEENEVVESILSNFVPTQCSCKTS